MNLRSFQKLVLLAVLVWGINPAAARSESLLGFSHVAGVPLLIRFESQNPILPRSIVRITGLASGQQLVGLDVRPANGKVYGLATTSGTSNSRSSLYEINTTSGAATAIISQLSTDLQKDGGFETKFGFDFNPQIDRIRVVSDRDQNLVLNPNGGSVTAGVNLFYAPGDANEGENPNVTQIAYDQNVAGTVATQLRAIDTDLDIVAKLANSAGTLNTVGPLGIDVEESGGFDVAASGQAFALLTPEDSFLQNLYSINLQTGQATFRGIAVLGVFRLGGLTTLP